MGQAINKLNDFRAKRDTLIKEQERITRQYGGHPSGLNALLDGKHKEIYLASLD